MYAMQVIFLGSAYALQVNFWSLFRLCRGDFGFVYTVDVVWAPSTLCGSIVWGPFALCKSIFGVSLLSTDEIWGQSALYI